jgi:NAD(P)-dependent dehydrogenase (short-subunit alcohol dehydrogenase family)
MGQLDGKTSVVTGGGTGIGLATAVRLADEGAYVFITGRRKDELDAAIETIGPARATAVVGDVSEAARPGPALRGGPGTREGPGRARRERGGR